MFLFLRGSQPNAFSYSDEWRNYTNGSIIGAIADDGQTIWIATNGGLMKIDKSTDEISYLNMANSGLPQNDLKALALDDQNCLWIATGSKGLVKYDGVDWTLFQKSNSWIPSTKINSIAIDSNHTLWIGTQDSGLVKFDGHEWIVYNEELPQNNIWALVIDRNNHVWMAVKENGIAKFDGTDWTFYNMSNSGMPSNLVTSIVIDKKNNVWVGASVLAKFDGENWSVFDSYNSDLPGKVSILSVDSKDHIWVGTIYGLGLGEFDGQYWKNYNFINSGLPHHYVAFIHVDKDDNKWISVSSPKAEYIFSKFSGNEWIRYNTSNSSLLDNIIFDIEIDKDNNKWFASQGLSKYDDRKWTVYSPSGYTSSVQGYIRGLTLDKSGNLWIGEDYKLVKYDGVHSTVYDGRGNGRIRTLAVDSNDNVWIGFEKIHGYHGTYFGGGLVKFDGTKGTLYNQSNSGLIFHSVTSLVVDLEGYIWIGSEYENGIMRYDALNCDFYETSGKVLDICVDGDNRKWFGTTQGIIIYDGTTWEVIDTLNSGLPHNSVHSIMFGENEDIWIGTWGGGLIKFDGTNWNVFNSGEYPLPNDFIRSLAIDSLGNIWIGTYAGIVVYDVGGGLIDQDPAGIPKNFWLQNYPNPFNTSTLIRFGLSRSVGVRLKVFDISGRVVTHFDHKNYQSGIHEIRWNGVDQDNLPLATGVYLAVLYADNEIITKKMILLR